MASSSPSFPDVWTWIQNLPPMTQWKSNSMSLCICSCASQPSLKLSITKYHQSSFNFSIQADYNIPFNLWTSKPLDPSYALQDKKNMSNLWLNIVVDILSFSPNGCPHSPKFPNIDSSPEFRKMFNFTFLSLVFLICIYEAPSEIRTGCLNILQNQFACPRSRETSLMLMRVLGSNIEEQWMRSINLALTNWISELQGSRHNLKSPSPLYSYAISAFGLWKVQLYCPVIAMNIQNSSNSPDDRLLFSLNYHQLEGVIQLNYKVVIRENWIEVMMNTDNIRCEVIRLIKETLMNERGAGSGEKHFPSRISLHVTPLLHTNVLSISVSKSSQNPISEIGLEKTIEASLEPTSPFVGINISAGESMTTSLKPWKFEQSAYGNSAILNWFLHDTSTVDGKEVVSSKPSKLALLQPKAWFRNRSTNAHRPFNKEGGVIFAGDEYGDSVCWKVDKRSLGKVMEWEIRGWIYLTYWPNKHRTLYSETRRAEFREVLHLTLA
ncbi:OLC1v1026912C1 [Oldenlandia corymbosa var. corymbosa]|uniref:OLC1v1026912C1 n=1 Tax=Oldenlandia corymbosa var. corymbosa TaxID=529605 RepID=A0AAV1CAE0_OLDCO|nr:OLC1v1026912C1 [Oldenlandia corymbosa var. corymbosa]